MRHHNLQVTGSVVVNGLGVATASELTAYTASTDAKISTLQAFTSSVGTTNTFTASASGRLNSIETITASNIGRLNSIETITASNVARLNSIETITASNVSRLNSLEAKTGSLATTGSNTFIGIQTITGSLYISSDLIVQGSSSLQNITASAVSIGTNLINLNTANPAIRYAGISVQDSGSANGVTGSMLWDSTCNRWLYSNPSGVDYSGGIIMSGPRAATFGTETTLTCHYIAKSGGGDHLYDSCIYESGSRVGINTSTLSKKLHICGTGSEITFDVDSANLAVIRGNVTTNFDLNNEGFGGCIRLYGSEVQFRTNAVDPAVVIKNSGITCFACTICAPIVSIGSCLLINQTCSLLESVTTKVEMSGIGTSTPYLQASYNVFANHGANCTWIGYLNFNKSRGTTQGSVTAVVNGDRIGMVRFSGADGFEQIRATEIYSEVDGTVGKCCVPGRIIFATTGNNLDGPIERFRISNTGVSTISGEGLFINRPTISSGEPYIFWQKNGTNRGAIYGADGVSGLRYFGLSHCFEGTICTPSLRVQSAFADLTLCGSNTTSPHLGGTFSITTNQDALGRTIIGNSSVGRAIYLESNGQTAFNCGIKFGNGSGCLNYYQQGTFSPAFAGSTSGCGVPSGANSALGYYTRIGNQVFITVAVNSSTFPSYSGDLRMYLPFTACDGGGLSSVTYHGPPIYFYPLANWGSSYCINDITTYILGATNYLTFNIYGLGTDRQNAVTSANTNLSGAAGIYTRFSINYTAV